MSRGRRARAADPPAGPWIEPGEIGPQLLLPAPPALDASFPATLEAALAGGRVAAVLLDPAAAPADGFDDLAAACRARCREARCALFLVGDAARVIACAADGLLARTVEAIEPARRILGLERPIGVACGGSRHRAMEAGEAGADWLLLGDGEPAAATLELVAWWSQVFVLPCAAPCPSPEAAAALVAAGADFLVPDPGLWRAPAVALAPLRAALAQRPARSG